MKTEEEAQTAVLDVSVIVPTAGRPEQLRITLESLAACRPRANEILVIDQSKGDAVANTVAEFASAGALRIQSAGRGIGLAVNEGLSFARGEVVLTTHDDCSVAANWVVTGHGLAAQASSCIFTGRVLPDGPPEMVPSTNDDPTPRDFTGNQVCHVLYPSNMVVPRRQLVDFGGFDERFQTAAEDNDLCYRWLKAGRCLRYEPSLVVWHRGWRTEAELRNTYVDYWRAQGRFYAKHLLQGDKRILRFLFDDARYGVGMLRTAVRRSIRRQAPLVGGEQLGFLRGLLPGLVSGWREFRKRDLDRDRV